MSIQNNKPLNHTLKNLIDRPQTHQIKNFDRVTVELSPHMTEIEIDRCIEFMNTISDSRWDINPSVGDCVTQLELMFGRDRVRELIMNWSERNQKLLSVFGVLKYRHKVDKTLWDGLDPGDNPNDYEKIYV